MRRIAVFARWPDPGKVKTRLSPALSAPVACDLYRAMLEDALAAAAASGAAERFVYWADAPGDAGAPRIAAVGMDDRFEPRRQLGQDLGARLERAFAGLLREPEDRAVIMGADCPALDGAILRGAFDALERHDLALGPARNGGCYLIGLARTVPDLFRGIPWSAARVLDETVERARAIGLTTFHLPALEDLDTPEDLVRWIRRVVLGPEPPALRTADSLREMGLLPRRTGGVPG